MDVKEETGEQAAQFGMRLRELRRSQEISQTELASRAGSTQSVISQLESREKPPRDMMLSTMVQLAAGLGCRIKIRLVDNVGVET